jgi:hypothetical protein
MCGRVLRCKGKIGETVRPVPPCVRPFGAVVTIAGLDEFRGSDPNQFFALDGALTPWAAPIPGSTGSSSPLSTLASIVSPSSCQSAYAAGTAYVAPRASNAEAIRAVLLASAMATTFGRLRSISRAAHALLALVCRANRRTAVAPTTRRRCRYPSPCLLIPT